MKQFDYGYHGDESCGTDFWCFITDILVDDRLVVMTEDGERCIVDPDRFTRLGSLSAFIISSAVDEESVSTGMNRVITSKTYRFHLVNNTFVSGPDLLSAYVRILQEVHAHTESAKPLVFHPSPAWYSGYVTLAKAVPSFNGGFTVGHTYFIYRGCLLNECGECYADRIESIAQLNEWDEDACVWEEELDFDSREKELYQAVAQ